MKKADGVYSGEFNGNNIEIRQLENQKWAILINGTRTQNVPFPTKDKAVRCVERQAEKVVEEKRLTAVAHQGKFSSITVSRKAYPHNNRRG
jgi:hypothetical protein